MGLEADGKVLVGGLQKLRGMLARRGATASVAGLTTALGAHAVTAAPAGLAASVSSAALTSAAASGGVTLTLLKLMAMTKLQVESYPTQNRRSAESLVAAFRLAGDRSLLQEAVEKSPNEPRVSFAGWIAAQTKNDAPPEERRQWLDAFKQSAPDNALANYLSAQDYFKSGQTDRAVEELIAAAGSRRQPHGFVSV